MTYSPIKDFFLNVNSRYNNYSFSEMLERLVEQNKVEGRSSRNPVLYVVAGPNGSGKSTLVTNFINQKLINDPFVNAGIYVQTKFKNIEDEKERNKKSMDLASDDFNRLVSQKKTFVFETLLTHESKFDMIDSAKRKGYKIVSIFVFTNEPEINLDRVNRRELEGGIGVEEYKLRDRYLKSLQNAKKLQDISDEYHIMNNTREK